MPMMAGTVRATLPWPSRAWRAGYAAMTATTLALVFTACGSDELYPGCAEHFDDAAAQDAALNELREQEARAEQYVQDDLAENGANIDRLVPQLRPHAERRLARCRRVRQRYRARTRLPERD